VIKKIKILDCTLRDGGYINNWEFSQSQIYKIVSALEKSNIDIIELGYLDDKKGCSINSTLFDSVVSMDKALGDLAPAVQKVAMMDLFSFDIDKLPLQSDTKINGIRLAFHKKDINDALATSEKIINLGYQLFLQPMVTKNYTDDDFLALIKKANRLSIYAFYVVDSFGSMSLNEFQHYIALANKSLNPSIVLGYHSHNNMQLAFSNAIDLCFKKIDREVILDSSIYGMGRGAGNLNTELIADYLNTINKHKYQVIPLLEVIDEILVYYFKKYPWGFSPAQYLSASLNCHPNYASYLVNKKTTNIADIRQILDKISLENKNSFNKKIVDNLYQVFLLTDKSKPKGKLNIPSDKKILLVASGSSVNDSLALIKNKVASNNYVVVALNHKPQFSCDYYFFSNQQRFDKFTNELPLEKQVITTNIRSEISIETVVPLKNIVYVENDFVTNVTILMINYLILNHIKKVEIVGLDGYQIGRNNYSYDETNVVSNENLFQELNEAVINSLYMLKKNIDIELLTPSAYINTLKG
jgi:hypothetical protein